MDLNSLILLKILLMIINTLLNEHSQSEVMYVDIIVLYYAFKKCNDISMQEIILDISNNDDVVDFVNKMFYICESSDCSLLQCCNRC